MPGAFAMKRESYSIRPGDSRFIQLANPDAKKVTVATIGPELCIRGRTDKWQHRPLANAFQNCWRCRSPRRGMQVGMFRAK